MFFSCCFLGALIAISLLTGCASLSKASINGNLDQVKQLLHDGENINEYDRWGWTPLLWAIYYDYPGIVNFLLENGANPNATTHARYGNIEIGSTPLIIASYYGYTEIVLRLLNIMPIKVWSTIGVKQLSRLRCRVASQRSQNCWSNDGTCHSAPIVGRTTGA